MSLQLLGGEDTVNIDDIDVAGMATFNLGAGHDTLTVDTNISLPFRTRFGNTFMVDGGAGDDVVDLSGSGGTAINFGGPVRLRGGEGTDQMQAFAGNTYVRPFASLQEDFEIGGF